MILVRVIDGTLHGQRIQFLNTRAVRDIDRVGMFTPKEFW